MPVIRRLLLPIALLLSGCGSDVERVQSVGAGKGDYRRSPCACFLLNPAAPAGGKVS